MGRQADVNAHMKHWPIGTEPIASWIRASYAAMTRNGVNVCEEAWLLQRAGAVRGAEGGRRLEDGTLAHRRIGRQTDRVRRADRAQHILLLAIFALVILLVFGWVGAAQLVHA